MSIRDLISRGDSPDVRVYPGIVTAQTAGSQTYGPASAMRYSVFINIPGGPIQAAGLAPVEERWSDTINVIPIQVGSVVLVASVAGELQMLGREIPFVEPCGGPSMRTGSALLMQVASMTQAERAELRRLLAL